MIEILSTDSPENAAVKRERNAATLALNSALTAAEVEEAQRRLAAAECRHGELLLAQDRERRPHIYRDD